VEGRERDRKEKTAEGEGREWEVKGVENKSAEGKGALRGRA